MVGLGSLKIVANTAFIAKVENGQDLVQRWLLSAIAGGLRSLSHLQQFRTGTIQTCLNC